MMPTFLADAAVGHVAIFDGDSETPFSNPYGNLDKLHFHTMFDYIAFDSATPLISTNVSIDGSLGVYSRFHTLGAHGKSGFPFVFGRCNARGVWMPLAGSVPVAVWTGNEANVINLTLAVSSSHVGVAETRSFNGAGTFDSFNVPVQVFVSREVA